MGKNKHIQRENQEKQIGRKPNKPEQSARKQLGTTRADKREKRIHYHNYN